jgi:hypothetical protein
VLVGALIVGVLATYAIVVSGNIRDKELKRELKDKDDQIANARGEEAKAVSAEANVRAEEAKERALNAGKEVAKLQTEAAVAKRRQAEAETQLAKVTKRQEPRSINIELIASALKTAPPAKVILLYQQGLPKSANFASMVHQALNKGGWKVLESKAVPVTTTWGYSTQGDMMLMAGDLLLAPMSESIHALMNVFAESAIDIFGTNDAALPENTIRLIIFPKP